MKKKLFVMLTLAAVTIIFAGCKEDADETSEVNPELSVSPASISATAAANSYPIAVTSNTTWAATVNTESAAWCTLTNAGATGNGTITVNVTANTLVEPRTATVTVTAGTLTKQVAVTQEAAAAALILSTEVYNDVAAAGANTTITVTANVTWDATVTAGGDFITVSDKTGHDGVSGGSFKITVAQNATSSAQSGTVTVTGGGVTRYVAVAQQAAAAVLTLNTEEYKNVAAAGANTVITVTANVTWDATVTAGGNFITVSDKAGNAGTSGGSFKITVNQNQTQNAQSGTVTVTGGGVTRYVAVEQQAAAAPAPTTPTYAESANTWSFGSSGLVWSDVINIVGCNNTDLFTSSTITPYCRSYTPASPAGNHAIYYYYNYPYMKENKATMCPEPWRVPTKDDIDALEAALLEGGKTAQEASAALVAVWGNRGGRINGGAAANSTPSDFNNNHYYWADTCYDGNDKCATNRAYYLRQQNSSAKAGNDTKERGMQIRCVKGTN
ncbi:MAG: hypothetical protein LBF69_06175 [Prevotellaceae bacterium]|jgi:uncharacterized protein (TIGR02145 family)|nr:hypothetical protein [Prevotellaceae bacterium]